MTAVDRHFLGWERPAVDLAVEWLQGRYGADLSRVVVALPGARAGRLLLERLVQAQPADWQPPTIVTTGRLTDELVRLERPSASRLVRTLAWEHALRELGSGDLHALVATPPEADDERAWRRLAGEVRGVFGVLSAECLDFAAVSEGAMDTRSSGEQRRWRALAQAQEAAEAFLLEAGLCDPHRGRLEALGRGDLNDPERQVVLVGVADAIGLVRRLVGCLENVSALVFAPDEASGAFDDMGCLTPQAWLQRSWALPVDAWRIAVGPDDQARQTVRVIAGWKGRYSAEQITVGVGDAEVAPFLQRLLREQDIFARDAEGTGHGTTPPARLLGGVAALLRRGRFADLAALVRHPHVEDFLAAGGATELFTCAELLDEYHLEHLPGPMPRPWLRAVSQRHTERNQLAARLGDAVQEWLAPLGGRPRPMSQWGGPVREVLSAIYGERKLDLTRPADRPVQTGLAGLAQALARMEELPASADPTGPATEALEILLSEAAADRIPPRAPETGEASIEMLGWLELAFDEAPALVVTGFNEGHVPEAVSADGWLPDSLRRELGLPDDERRLARDLYTLEWIVRSREETVLLSGRRTLQGDPLRPSRLAFHGSPTEVLERVRHFLEGSAEVLAPPASSVGARQLLLPEDLKEPTRWSASAFSACLQSPYVFALTRLAGLKTLDDRDQEMGPLQFGILGHEILRQFALGDLAASTDPEAIAAFLDQTLEAECARRFGQAPLPAVQLQRRQLAYRLELFARAQAAWCEQGWRIERVEWTPSEDVTLDVDGEAVPLTGQIDRIDKHEDGRWAILDYKFGEKAKVPEKEHLRGGDWVNVQLPLYRLLAREVVGEDLPALGFFNVAATEAESGLRFSKGWDQAALDEALNAARDVVREVREQLASDEPVFERGRPRIFDPVLAHVCGEGLLSFDSDEGDDD